MNRIAAITIIAGALLVASPAAAGPREYDGPKLGIVAVELTPELREHLGAEHAVMVGRVAAGSAAATAGVEVGDLLMLVDGMPVDDAEDVRAALQRVDDGTAELRILRDGSERTLTATLPTPAANSLLRRFLWNWWWGGPAPHA